MGSIAGFAVLVRFINYPGSCLIIIVYFRLVYFTVYTCILMIMIVSDDNVILQ